MWAALAAAAIGQAWDIVPGADGPRLQAQLAALAAIMPAARPAGPSPADGQRAADRHAALRIDINPEGRVKCQRGPAPLTLVAGAERCLLVKIVNHSGGQPRLAVRHRYPGAARSPFAFAFRPEAGGPTLVGALVEYRALAVRCAVPGRHEATVAFDAGQGTQDLGFRGEAPMLFDVAPRGER